MTSSTSNKQLTPRQADVIDFIENFVSEKSYSPTIDEIAKGIGLSNRSSAYQHLVNLKDKGLVTWNEGEVRTIRVIKPKEDEAE